MPLQLREEAGRKNPGALGVGTRLNDLFAQALHPHVGVIVIEDFPLGAGLDESVVHHFVLLGRSLHQFPLCGGGQGNPKIFLQLGDPIHGQARAITK